MNANEITRGLSKTIRVARAKDELCIVDGVLNIVERELLEEKQKARFGLPSTVTRKSKIRDIVWEVWLLRYQRVLDVEAEE